MGKHMGVFERLLGKDATKDTTAALVLATKKLDKAGITRKQEEGEATENADTVLAALESVGAGDVAGVVGGILKVLEELGGVEALDTAAGSHAELIAKLVQAVTGGAAPEPEAMEEDEEELPLPEGMEMKSMLKSLVGYVQRSTQDMGDVAKTQAELTAVVKELAPLGEQFSALSNRIEKIESLFQARPRSAAKSDETVVVSTGGSRDESKIKKEIEGGLGEDTVSVLNLKVKKRKDASYANP